MKTVEGWAGEYSKHTGVPIHRTPCGVCGEDLLSDAYEFVENKPIALMAKDTHSGNCQIEWEGYTRRERIAAKERWSPKGRMGAMMAQTRESNLRKLMAGNAS